MLLREVWNNCRLFEARTRYLISSGKLIASALFFGVRDVQLRLSMASWMSMLLTISAVCYVSLASTAISHLHPVLGEVTGESEVRAVPTKISGERYSPAAESFVIARLPV